MNKKLGTVVLAVALTASLVKAESITHGGTTINMGFVDIGYAGNEPQSAANRVHAVTGGDGRGSVENNYRISKFEVTASQWASVIATDSNVGDAGAGSGSQPTANTSWYEAAKFCNWLTSGSYSNGAYQFSDPNTLATVDRNAAIVIYGTVYVLPTENEWYKAAYFKSDGSGYTLYATGDADPVAEVDANYGGYGGVYSTSWAVGTGLAENNGTFDMTGNLWEWTESASDGVLDVMTETRIRRGGALQNPLNEMRSSLRVGNYPSNGSYDFSFRVAAITLPPPGLNILSAVEVEWSSISGATYLVQYSTN